MGCKYRVMDRCKAEENKDSLCFGKDGCPYYEGEDLNTSRDKAVNRSDMNCIGISEDKLHHILGVARKAYRIAKEMGKDENFCRRCFMLGWIHDIGYEFSKEQSEHPDVSAMMLLLMNEGSVASDLKKPFYKAIRDHGRYPSEMTDEYRILNMADMLVDSRGREVTVSQRLDDIKDRYGEHSDQYLTACDVCYRIGLTAVNMSGNIT